MPRDMDILPVELQQDIFGYLCGLPTVDVGKVGQDELRARQRAPFMLATISRRWRDLCLQTPELWSFYDIGLFADLVNKRDVEYAELCLQRSAQAALDVIISCQNSNVFKRHLQLLEQHQVRWRRICLMFPRYTDGSEVAQMIKRPMPRLRELRLISQVGPARNLLDRSWSPSESDILSFVSESPRLQRLDSHIFLFTPTAPMPSLTFLTFNLRGYSNALPLWHILALTPALEDLVIIFPVYPNWLKEPIETDVSLFALRRLTIWGYTVGESWASHLIAPCMDTLTVSVEWCNHSRPLFDSLLVRNQVKHLILSTVETYDGGFLHRPDAAAIGELEALETFELRGLRQVTFKSTKQTFFEFLSGDIEEDPAPAWADAFGKLVIRDCRFNFLGCRTMSNFVQRRFELAGTEGGNPFEFELVNTVFVVADGQEPAISEGARAHFANYIENIVVRRTKEPYGVMLPQVVPSPDPQAVTVAQDT